jgi:hypothetical protein
MRAIEPPHDATGRRSHLASARVGLAHDRQLVLRAKPPKRTMPGGRLLRGPDRPTHRRGGRPSPSRRRVAPVPTRGGLQPGMTGPMSYLIPEVCYG